MDNKDLVITPQLRVPDGSTISARPCHLVTLKTKPVQRFIALDKPDMTQSACIQVKGIFSEESAETIISSFKTVLQSANKEDIVEMCFPWAEVQSIRSLVFKAK